MSYVMPDAIEIGRFQLDKDAIAHYALEKLCTGKRILYYRQYFRGMDNSDIEFKVVDCKLLFHDSPITTRVAIDLEALNHKWTVLGNVTETSDQRFILSKIGSIHCTSAAACHAEVYGGRRRFRAVALTKMVARPPYSPFVSERLRCTNKNDAGVQYVLSKTRGRLPLDCNDCKHKMKCLIAPHIGATFEPIDDLVVNKEKGTKPNQN